MNDRNRIIKSGSRAGIVLFVVLGGIFILSIMIMSYNHLVRGKFNESRELLKHLRAMKCAQSISRYIISKMKADLIDPSSEASSPGQILRAAFRKNSAAEINSDILRNWMPLIGFIDLRSILTSNQPYEVTLRTTNIEVSDVKTLDDGNGFYLDFEKSGRITVEVEVNVDQALEKWAETRPFRVVMPFPLPITKFNLYLRDATGGNETKFNTVTVATPDTGDVISNSPRPLVLVNGEPTNSSTPDDIWKSRGWVYMGGGPALLNRAAGHRKFGQNFHSYFPSADKPITLIFNFGPWPVGTRQVSFSVARWGFSETIYSGPHSQLWQQVLQREFNKYPITSKSRWASSCLHLFGENSQNSSASMISHTRVTGDIKDRFLEICYLADAATKVPVGAIISMNSTAYDNARSSASNIPGMSSLFVENKLIYMPNGPSALGVQDMSSLEPLFLSIPWLTNDGSLCYYTIMSKIDDCSYSETYDMIAQYTSTNQKIDIPPTKATPLTSDRAFQLEIEGIDTRNIEIDKIAAGNDPTLGMARRICYEVKPGQGEDAFGLLKKHFCNTAHRLNLGNAVLRVVTGGAGLTLGDSLGRHTGGNIIVDGPVTVGTFEPPTSSLFEPPLMITAEKGAITVKNGGSNSTLAYLVALDPNAGEVKYANPNSPMNLVGGIAAHTLNPANIAGGGNLTYNISLDPTNPNFIKKYVGVVIGPAGGDI